MSAPFTVVPRDEIARLAELTSVEIRVLLAVRTETRNGWATRRREIAKVAGCSDERVRVALAALERAGWFRREWCGGAKSAPWGRFRVQGTPIQPDRGSGGNPDPVGSGYTSQVPDPIQNPPSKTGGFARAAGAGREGGAGDALLPLVAKLWPELSGKPARRYLGQLRALAPDASDDDLARYLRRAAQDRTLESARVPLAVAVSADRVQAWRRRAVRRRDAPSPKPAPDVLSARELAHLVAARRR